ncbi:LysR family transcriptional regulator [Pseudomonas sp. GB2N2]
MDQLNAIRVFVQVVELAGFTKAAKSLGMPKTTVSKLIGDLEAHLKVKLLKRSTRSVHVTPEGAAYYERTTRWLDELREIDGAFDSVAAELHGLVHVDASAWVASSVIIPRLPDFYARYPSIEIEISVGDRAAHLIRERADCAIRSGVVNDLSMVARPLGASPWVTAATPAYLQQHGIPLHPSDLSSGHVVINYQSTSSGRSTPLIFLKDDEPLNIEVPALLTVNESNAHLAAGLTGIGLLYSFEWKLRPYLEDGRLVRVLEEWQPAAYPFHLVYPPNRHMSVRTRAFIDWVTEQFESLSTPS